MKWGKTKEQKFKEYQEYLAKVYTSGVIKFAWLPTRLENGRWCWLEKFKADLNIYYQESGGGLYYRVRESGDAFYSVSYLELHEEISAR
jgi:hypothetical protein